MVEVARFATRLCWWNEQECEYDKLGSLLTGIRSCPNLLSTVIVNEYLSCLFSATTDQAQLMSEYENARRAVAMDDLASKQLGGEDAVDIGELKSLLYSLLPPLLLTSNRRPQGMALTYFAGESCFRSSPPTNVSSAHFFSKLDSVQTRDFRPQNVLLRRHSCVKLLSEITEAVFSFDNSRMSARFCWLQGPTGSGKSAVAHTVSAEADRRRILASSFFITPGVEGYAGVEGHDDPKSTSNHSPYAENLLYTFIRGFAVRSQDFRHEVGRKTEQSHPLATA